MSGLGSSCSGILQAVGGTAGVRPGGEGPAAAAPLHLLQPQLRHSAMTALDHELSKSNLTSDASSSLTLPCGMILPNRLVKVSPSSELGVGLARRGLIELQSNRADQ